ncbi:hypothetical protein [Ruminococcus sp.]|uniref:hypothetical protein n=1 Tax=Ruminococcus sp. TaxID=41978 RepID=UPI0025E122EE|nr:hypothetical protein [Ruminococcus sp.]MCI5815844.1 hypothetical protein [Ruminococcus sp.]MDD7555336.1 hypothetical protein [Ruminococcus sp.]MDY4963411.1 hypothetical protein [Ruminococcus callidus]
MAFISMVFAFLAVILFILGILQVVGTVLLAVGSMARSNGHPALAAVLQTIGVILVIPVLLSMACVPVFYIICMLQ